MKPIKPPVQPSQIPKPAPPIVMSTPILKPNPPPGNVIVVDTGRLKEVIKGDIEINVIKWRGALHEPEVPHKIDNV